MGGDGTHEGVLRCLSTTWFRAFEGAEVPAETLSLSICFLTVSPLCVCMDSPNHYGSTPVVAGLSNDF